MGFLQQNDENTAVCDVETILPLIHDRLQCANEVRAQ